MTGRHHRVTRGDDYRQIVRTGRRIGGQFCVTHAVLHTSTRPARFGFIVSKAVGNAVVRNKVRRRLKTIAQQSLHANFFGADVVFRALPASAHASFGELEYETRRALEKVRVWVAEATPQSSGHLPVETP